jgi:GR25 family glycosyltransferase involved in LPS biosynthesis
MLLKLFLLFLFICIIAIYVLSIKPNKKEGFDPNINKKLKVYYINLDKNEDRRKLIENYYSKTNMHGVIPLERFSAVRGDSLNIENLLTKEAVEELKQTEMRGYRTKHYQLTRGAIGCYVSHYKLMKLLKEDPVYDYYLIFEDDAIIHPSIHSSIEKFMKNAPKEWDILLLGTHRLQGEKVNEMFTQVSRFWGMAGYIINKKGVLKFEAETDKISMQIDSYLAYLSQQQKMNIYAVNPQLVLTPNNVSTIQMPLKLEPGINPYEYKGYIL